MLFLRLNMRWLKRSVRPVPDRLRLSWCTVFGFRRLLFGRAFSAFGLRLKIRVTWLCFRSLFRACDELLLLPLSEGWMLYGEVFRAISEEADQD